MKPFIPTPYRYSCIKNWVRGAETKITEPVTSAGTVSAHSRGFHGRLAFEEERTYSKCTGVLHGSEYSLAPGRDSVEQLMVRCAACAGV